MRPRSLCKGIAAAAILVATGWGVPWATAQTATGGLRGTVTDETGGVLPGATVLAVNVDSGLTRETMARKDGTYDLRSLQPGAYEVTGNLAGFAASSSKARIQVGQILILDLRMKVGGVSEQVVVESAPAPIEIRSSEVGINISTEQIENLPQNNRNFLNFATLAPGIRLNQDEFRQEVVAGGQPGRTTNVFVDGVSLKNDVLEGGVVGQDASRGNPFPQNAVQEFRVITQNFKAEYQKSSSAVITSVTKSGGNQIHGDAFASYQDKSLVAIDDFAKKRDQPKPNYTRWQVGASLSGPIVKDKAHFFLSYEGNFQNRDNQVFLNNANAPAGFKQYEGVFPSNFRSNLFFGKLSYQTKPDQIIEVSGNLRHETDVRGFGGQISYESAENVKIDVGYVSAKHRLTRPGFVNEVTLNFTDAKWNPVPLNPNQVGQEYQSILRIGGRDTEQLFDQKRYSIRDDFTKVGARWYGDHVIKVGANLDFLSYDVTKHFYANPKFNYRTDISLDFPFEAQYGVGDPTLNADNRQFGIYAQDDWNVTSRVQLNLGVRWDYESDMLNNDYVTPNEVRQALSPSIPSQYFTDGNDRPPYYGAIQPRVGLSWDVTGSGKTVVFGGYGRYVDRTVYNYTLDERFRLQFAVRTFRFSADGSPRDGLPTTRWQPSYLSQQGLDGLIASGTAPNPEVFLIDNDTKPANSDQFSAGLRQRVGDFTLSATYTGVRGKNDLTFIRGNRNPDGTCCQQLAPQYGNVLLSSDAKKSWFDALYLTVDKPYTSQSKWGLSVAYTLGRAEQIGGDLFSLDRPRVEDYPRYPAPNDGRHRLVLSGLAGLPADFRIGALITYGTGLPYTISDASQGWGPNQFRIGFGEGRADSFQTVDLRIEKSIDMPGSHRVSATAEVFNVFDHENYGCYNSFKPPLPEVNASFGQPDCLVEPGRRLQFGLNYSF